MILWIFLLLACSGPEPLPVAAVNSPDSAAKPTKVILISIDTLRADFLGCYDHPWVKTPFIDELAAEGALFRRHVSVSPTTLNSHMSMLTGTYPHRHGVPRNGFVADNKNQMLPEILGQENWRSAGFIGGYPLAAHFGFNQGFDHFDDDFSVPASQAVTRHAQRDGKAINQAVFEWLDGNQSEQPTFLFIHYFDVHLPYVVPEPYHSMYVDENGVAVEGTLADLRKVQRRFRNGDQRVWRVSKALMRRYAGGVSYADSVVGELFSGLRERDYFDDAMIILTSDHGETMDEHLQHEVWTHGYSVFDTSVHTPLIIKMPGGGIGARVQVPVSSIDITPTVLELLDIEVPGRVDGVSLAGGLLGKAPYPPDRMVFSEATKPDLIPVEVEDDPDAPLQWVNAELARSARTANYKYISIPHKGQAEFYDLLRDPGEQQDLTVADGEAVAPAVRQVANRLTRWSAKAKPFPAEYFETDPEATSLLEALGYVEDEEAPVAPEDFVFQPGMDELVDGAPE